MSYAWECPSCGESHDLDENCLTAALLELDSDSARSVVDDAGYSGMEDPTDLVQNMLRTIRPSRLPSFTAALWASPTIAKALRETQPS